MPEFFDRDGRLETARNARRSLVGAIAVKSSAFVESVESELGSKAAHRAVILDFSADLDRIQNPKPEKSKIDWVRPTTAIYAAKLAAKLRNSVLWDESAGTPRDSVLRSGFDSFL